MRFAPCFIALLFAAAPASAFTDSDAAKIAAQSPAVAKSVQAISAAIKVMPADLKEPTRDALLSDAPCIAYRKGETETTRKGVVEALIHEGFASDAAAASRSLYGYPANTDAACVHIAAPFLATAGSEAGSHHTWPGGLADHTAFNLHAAEDMVARYREVSGKPDAFDTNALSAAVLWHDWAKRLVLHWSDEGIVSYESRIAGTSSHHVIGLAEAMARGLPAREVLVQVCAHSAPSSESDAKVIGWLKAAAIIAHVDPVKAGYLKSVGSGYALEVRPECRIHNLSDSNWVYGVPAAQHAEAMLAKLVPALGYKDGEARRFILFALSYYGAERFDIVTEDEALKLLQELPKK